MMQVRQPAVAGMFYPAAAAELQQSVDRLLQQAAVSAPVGTTQPAVPKALVVPHAGYLYSGEVAARAYARLAPARDTIRRVILLGPSHRVGFAGIACCRASHYRTPLGDIELDQPALQQIADLPQLHSYDQAHLQEHSLEVHLPFLQRQLTHFTLLPLVVGQASPREVAELLERLWGGPETLVVISTDLSHYHDYATAQQLDRATSAAIERLDALAIGSDDACGRYPLNGLLRWAKSAQLRVERIDLRNSGDTAGPRDRVVGYGAWALYPAERTTTAPAPQLDPALQRQLCDLARQSIQHGLQQQQPLPLQLTDYPTALQAAGATFVTLERQGQLRGCIGTLVAHRPLVVDVVENAFAAAFRDPRFAPLRADELADLSLHISLLTPPVAMQFDSEADLLAQLRPGEDGLILSDGGRRGTFLPSVWAQLPDPLQFLRHLKQKAGLPADYWSPTLQVSRYRTEIFG